MKILILGGTQFVGLVTAQEALRRGHDVTVLNRGSQPAPKGAKAVIGDRQSPDGYAALDGMHFDAVIDTWQHDPVVIKNLVTALKGRMSHFIYVSTMSVYNFAGGTAPYDESTPVTDITVHPEHYSKIKARGEIEALQSGVPTMLARPGVVLGPEEGKGGRLEWWLSRMERGGPTLAPGPSDTSLQFIDVRDLAAFIIDGAEKRFTGPYNIVAERGHMTYGSFLEEINRTAGGKAELRWLEPEQFKESGVNYWVDLPISIPPEKKYLFQAAPKKAFDAGLRIRPAEETIRDTWAWLRNPETVVQQYLDPLGLDPEKEAEVLKHYFGK